MWDCTEMKRLRTMDGHTARVCSHSWNQYILSSGSRSGQIIHHDVRQRDHAVAVLSGHTEEVRRIKDYLFPHILFNFFSTLKKFFFIFFI